VATAWPEITALGTGTRDDRTLRSKVVSLPPFIADHSVALDSETAADLEAAAGIGPLLLRTESVAESKIEQIQANVDDYARALHGVARTPLPSPWPRRPPLCKQ
jgi:hypothetical protein